MKQGPFTSMEKPKQTRTGLESVDCVSLPRELADETQKRLRSAGEEGNEALVVWSGTQDGSTFIVQTLVEPVQRRIRSQGGVCVIVDGDVLHRLNVETFKRGERLFAQVHSHPARAYHSPMDDEYAVVTAPGSFSLVIPDFAVRPFQIEDSAIYRLTQKGRWDEVSTRRANEMIHLVDHRS